MCFSMKKQLVNASECNLPFPLAAVALRCTHDTLPRRYLDNPLWTDSNTVLRVQAIC